MFAGVVAFAVVVALDALRRSKRGPPASLTVFDMWTAIWPLAAGLIMAVVMTAGPAGIGCATFTRSWAGHNARCMSN